jgi:hypothetical protein
VPRLTAGFFEGMPMPKVRSRKRRATLYHNADSSIDPLFAFDCRTMLSLVCQKAERKKLARKHPREPQEPKRISRPISPKKVPGSELRRSRSDATASESRPSRTSWSVVHPRHQMHYDLLCCDFQHPAALRQLPELIMIVPVIVIGLFERSQRRMECWVYPVS